MYFAQSKKRIISILLIAVFICSFGISPYAEGSGEGTRFVYALEPKYEYLGYVIEGMALTREGLKVGYISTEGNLLKPQWDQAYQFKNGVSVVELNGQFGLIDKAGKYIVPLGKYKYIQYTLPYTDGFVRVSNNPSFDTGNVWGLVDTTTGKEILKPEYYRIEPFSDGLALVGKRGDLDGGNEKDKYGYIDRTGKFIIPLKFQIAGDFTEGVAPARVEQQGKYGYIDKTGKFVITPQWTGASSFEDSYSIIENGMLLGFAHRSGRVIMKPCMFPLSPYWIHEGKLYMLDENKLHTYDSTGKHTAVPFPIVTHKDGFSALSFYGFHDGLARIASNGKYGYINKKGDIVVPLKWDYALDFDNGIAHVQLYDTNGNVTETNLINTNGDLLYKEDHAVYFEFHDGLCSYREGSTYYIIDTAGKLVVTGEWEDMKEFSEGYAPVQKDGKWGYLDKTGKIAIEPQWDYAEPFVDGYAVVAKDEKYGLIKLIEGK